MPKTWTENRIHLSDQLRSVVVEAEREILRDLALDSLKTPEAWTPVDERQWCPFLATDGSTVRVEIGVATVGDSATVYSVRLDHGSLNMLCMPLVRIDEFTCESVDSEYSSIQLATQSTFNMKLREGQRCQPMKHEGLNSPVLDRDV
jgi:hypothetical protein